MKKVTWAFALPLACATVSNAVSFTTLITTPLAIEGLTNDAQGNLYTPGRALAATDPCPVYRTRIDAPALAVVGLIPAQTPTCSPSGLAFGPDGQLYVTNADKIYRFTPSSSGTPTCHHPGWRPSGPLSEKQ